MVNRAPRERIIAAIDVGELGDAAGLCASLAGHVGLAKIGLELFVAHGAVAVQAAKRAGLPVFLDLKLHDIPNTVEGAARSASRLGVRMLTVHASGGAAMIAAARKGLGDGENRPLLLAVTVLTSLRAEDLAAQGISGVVEEHALRLGRIAVESGADGLVCSPLEVATLRGGALGADPVLVVPGIRLAGSAAHDQARAATPASAVGAGADYIVIGRPLREGNDPAAAADAIAAELEGLRP